MSLETSGSCRNFDAVLGANCFFTSLYARVSQLILEETLDLRDFLFDQGFEIRREQPTR